MKKIKYNLQAMLADAARDEAGAKAARQLVSQNAIAAMLKQATPKQKTGNGPAEPQPPQPSSHAP